MVTGRTLLRRVNQERQPMAGPLPGVRRDVTEGHPPDGNSMRGRRQRRLLWLACCTAVVSVAGLIASMWVRSPAEIAAATGPPKASVITAPVSYQVLRDTVVFRATFSATETVSFTPAAEVAPSGSGPASQSLVVSRVPTSGGAEVRPGQVIAEVSDRPVFVLTGSVPAFRDMVQGDSGADISQLQAALAHLGYSCAGDTSGMFGRATAAAVKRFYAAIGYPVPLVTAGSSTPAVGKDSGSSAGTGAGQAASPATASTSAATSTTSLVEVPMAEVMFVPSFPATVASVTAGLGSAVTAPLVVLTVGGLRLTGQLDPSDAGQVRPGMRAQVTSNVTGQQTAGVVTAIGQVVTPGQNQAGSTPSPSASSGTGNAPGTAPYIPVQIRPDGTWANSWAGQDVELTVSSAATPGPVLAVPEAAITSDASADTSVTVVGPGGRVRRVQVRAGASAGGLVQVTPVAGGLAAGDAVAVGS